MDTPVPLSDEMLHTIGIAKPGHRKKLLLALHTTAFGTNTSKRVRVADWGGCCAPPRVQSPSRSMQLVTQLDHWLADLKLLKLHEQFVQAGYDSIQLLRDLMHSPYPVTEEILLTEIGIDKPGHRVRILGKLLDDVRFTEPWTHGPAPCGQCHLL